MKTIIYHNPNCSKSRATKELLESNNIDFNVKNYLSETIEVKELKDILVKLGFSSARDLMRKKEDKYKELDLDKEYNEDKLILSMIENPKLIERPIVVTKTSAAIGRPPENILQLFV